MTRSYCNHLCPRLFNCEATCPLECKKGSKVTDIVKGARVRVTYEAVANHPSANGRVWHVTTDDGHNLYAPRIQDIEVIAPPERQFEDGALYLEPGEMYPWRYSAARDDFCTTSHRFERKLMSSERQAAMVKLVPETSS